MILCKGEIRFDMYDFLLIEIESSAKYFKFCYFSSFMHLLWVRVPEWRLETKYQRVALIPQKYSEDRNDFHKTITGFHFKLESRSSISWPQI